MRFCHMLMVISFGQNKLGIGRSTVKGEETMRVIDRQSPCLRYVRFRKDRLITNSYVIETSFKKIVIIIVNDCYAL